MKTTAKLWLKVKKSRSTLLQVGGCGFVSAAACLIWLPAGLVVIGVSLFLLEYLSNGER